ncbi:MAG TPA: helix-turn-helix domain-containing protein [Allosphingosinicella sp.]|jgi:hypothetical protein
MATQFYPDLPPSVAALPFLFVRPQAEDDGWTVRAALAAALAAERADTGGRNSRTRVAYLLSELGYQLARRGFDRDAELPLPRAEIARALGLSLCKVKRILAMLCLSQVIATDGSRMRVLDWPRLCALGGFDPRRLELREEEEEDRIVAILTDEDSPLYSTTAAGDPACFT